MSPDWFERWRADAQLVSDEAMQYTYARILVGEAAAPGSFSARTLTVVRDLDQASAALLKQIRPFILGEGWMPDVHELRAFYQERGVRYGPLTRLAEAGLLRVTSAESFIGRTTTYGRRCIRLEERPRRFGTLSQMLGYFLTTAGRELIRIIPREDDDAFFAAVLQWMARSYKKVEWAELSGSPDDPLKPHALTWVEVLPPDGAT